MSSINLNRHFKGIRFRLTLVYSTLFGLVLCMFAYVITSEYFQSGRQDFDSSLINYAIDLSDHIITENDGVNIAFKVPSSEIKKAFPFILKQTYYTVRDIKGKVLAVSPNENPFGAIPFNPALPLEEDYTHRLLTFKLGDDFYRAINLKITTSNNQAIILQVATIYNFVKERENNHLLVTILMVPFLILGSSFISFLIAGNALSPIKTLIDTANSIAAQNLSLRVPEFRTGDEVEELAKTLNSLLNRLEQSFIAQTNFVSNASHQLNTPLAIIKGELDVLQSKERSPEEIKKFHESLREELERLIELVKNMLLVSRVKSGLATFVFHPVRLDDVLVTTTTRLNKKAREKKIVIRFDIDEELTPGDLEVMGEKQLLDAAFENLLDNAIKYSPDGSIIQMNIKKIEGHTTVWIQDQGPGMDDEEFQMMIKNRFSRGTDSIPGTGIGLPLAGKIAGFHNAKISCKKLTPVGSLFMIDFPNDNATI